MGKKIRVQRRGRGGSVFRASTHNRTAPVRYPPVQKIGSETLKGKIEKLIHESGRGAPLAFIRCENGMTFYNVASERVYEGQPIAIGVNAPIDVGNILPISKIPDGTMIYNLETSPSDGGKLVRSSGTYATLIAHTPAGATVKFPSGKTAIINENARASIGLVAAAGRPEKPFIKAGEKYHLKRARGHKWPMPKGIAMVSVVHPHGGGRHKHLGKPGTVSRSTPPGRKVGLIAARVTGRAKSRRAK